MRRRHWIVAVALLATGCSSTAKPKPGKKPTTTRKKPGRSTGRDKMNRGPQGFGNVLIPAYIEDLKNGSPDKKITAAQELGNMGSAAKAALPVLEQLASDKNPKVSAAAKSAAAAIKKR